MHHCIKLENLFLKLKFQKKRQNASIRINETSTNLQKLNNQKKKKAVSGADFCSWNLALSNSAIVLLVSIVGSVKINQKLYFRTKMFLNKNKQINLGQWVHNVTFHII